MKKEFPQKIGALSGTAAFFFVLFVSLSYGKDLFDALLYAVYSFFALLILGWAVGTAIVYQKEEKQLDIEPFEPNPNETNTDSEVGSGIEDKSPKESEYLERSKRTLAEVGSEEEEKKI